MQQDQASSLNCRAILANTLGLRALGALGLLISSGCGPRTSSTPESPAATLPEPSPEAGPAVTGGPANTEPAVAAAKTEKRPHERYSYEDVLALLRSDDSVRPNAPPVHPVHTMYNREAVVPPMCYTRTEGRYNPCYVCHQDRIQNRPNRMDDGELQSSYSFSDVGSLNHWQNLFEDRTQRVSEISDAEIFEWVATDNYTELAPRLQKIGFNGYVPDLKDLQLAGAAFDKEGFAKDGSHWVAFNY